MIKLNSLKSYKNIVYYETTNETRISVPIAEDLKLRDSGLQYFKHRGSSFGWQIH